MLALPFADQLEQRFEAILPSTAGIPISLPGDAFGRTGFSPVDMRTSSTDYGLIWLDDMGQRRTVAPVPFMAKKNVYFAIKQTVK